MEHWRSVVGYEGRYEVSDQGRVRSLLTSTIMKVYTFPSGYQSLKLHKGDGGRTLYVHRIVAEAFLGNSAKGREINHKNLDKRDNRLENLEWVTSSENKRHAIASGVSFGRVCRGQKNPNAKLSQEDVQEIRRRYAEGETQTVLAHEFPVSRGMIGHIVRRANWVHI